VAIADLLATRTTATCIHPGWRPLVGRDAVLEAWRAIFAGPPGPPLVCEDPVGVLTGEAGLVVCLERLGEAVLAASNLFVSEHGLWRLAHHQAGPTAMKAKRAPPASRRLH
jgi:hypothetical protein